MASRLPSRLRQLAAVFPRLFVPRRKPASPKRILIIHHLLLGDTIMVTPLIAKLREQFPDAHIAMAMPKAFVTFYSNRPYGLEPLPFDPRDINSLRFLLEQPAFDWAIVPGDNRYGWTAFAMGARWIIGFGGDRPAYKSWCFDELKDYPAEPQAWGDMVADLVDGPPPAPYTPEHWPAPDYEPISRPAQDYAILHVGASSPLKFWPAERWLSVAAWLTNRGLQVIWSGGPGEEKLISDVDPQGIYPSYAGKLNLAQLWHLIANAKVLVCPDTGVAHLGRLTETPTVALFGPGSDQLFGAGRFWAQSPFASISEPIACRNQHNLFKRQIDWVQFCERSPDQCASPACMHLISEHRVLGAISATMQKADIIRIKS